MPIYALIVFLLFLGILARGCANVRTPVTINFVPAAIGPLCSLQTLTILLRVEDQRPADEQDSVARLAHFVGTKESWYTKEPAPVIVRDALGAQLAKCGHRVITDSSAPSNIGIKIRLTRFQGFIAVNSSKSVVWTQVNADVLVTDAAGKEAASPFQIAGTHKHNISSMISKWKGFDDDLSVALADFIRNLTFDSRLVEAIQAKCV
jgi:uncharacterized lipoprotein YajG